VPTARIDPEETNDGVEWLVTNIWYGFPETAGRPVGAGRLRR
jgi:hypothetical protein